MSVQTCIVSEQGQLRIYEISGPHHEAPQVIMRVIRMRETHYVVRTRGYRLPDRVVARVWTRYPHLQPTNGYHGSHGYSSNEGRPQLTGQRVRYQLTLRAWLVLAGAVVTVAAAIAVVWSITTATRAAIEWSVGNADLVVGVLFAFGLAALAIWRTSR